MRGHLRCFRPWRPESGRFAGFRMRRFLPHELVVVRRTGTDFKREKMIWAEWSLLCICTPIYFLRLILLDETNAVFRFRDVKVLGVSHRIY